MSSVSYPDGSSCIRFLLQIVLYACHVHPPPVTTLALLKCVLQFCYSFHSNSTVLMIMLAHRSDANVEHQCADEANAGHDNGKLRNCVALAPSTQRVEVPKLEDKLRNLQCTGTGRCACHRQKPPQGFAHIGCAGTPNSGRRHGTQFEALERASSRRMVQHLTAARVTANDSPSASPKPAQVAALAQHQRTVPKSDDAERKRCGVEIVTCRVATAASAWCHRTHSSEILKPDRCTQASHGRRNSSLEWK